MPRTRNPNDVLDLFLNTLQASLDTWRQTQTELEDAPQQLKKTVSLNAFLRIAVSWEVFRSDWHIAAINRDSSTFRPSVDRRFRESVRSGKFAPLERFVSLQLPQHLTIAAVRALLDPLERNISFGSNWVNRAQLDLAAPFVRRVTALPPADLLLVAASEQVRNAVAHQSPSAVDEMNSALLVLAPSDAELARTTRITAAGIAAYLHARPSSSRRVEIWHQRLSDIARKLRT